MKQLFYLGAISLACVSCSRENADPTPAAKPVAGFTVPATVSTQLPVQVQNTSINATTSTWTWGDGTSSTDLNPIHTYTKVGKVRLLLTVSGAGGTDTISKVISVTAAATSKLVAGFTIPTTVNAQLPMQVQNTSTNATASVWTWGDGTSSTAWAPSHTYAKIGKVRLLLTVTGTGGTDTISQIVSVTAAPAPTGLGGTYRGRLYTSSYGYSPFLFVRKDTTIQVLQPNAQTIITFGRTLTYLPTSNWPWGHIPDRSSYGYINAASYGSTTSLQKEVSGDSIQISSRSGGLGGGTYYEFYGKK